MFKIEARRFREYRYCGGPGRRPRNADIHAPEGDFSPRRGMGFFTNPSQNLVVAPHQVDLQGGRGLWRSVAGLNRADHGIPQDKIRHFTADLCIRYTG